MNSSLLDWKGPEFLLFYAVAFCVAIAWSVFRRIRSNDKFALNGADEISLTNPYEIAYLAGGAPRCSQVVLLRLIKSGAVEWKRAKVFRESKLVAIGSAEPGFNEIERTVFSSILSYGKTGMPLTGIPQLVGTRLSGIESKLAKLGLRPTASETGGRGFFISLPLYMLIVVGLVKMLVGISRDKPVGFLLVFMFFTLIAALIIGSVAKKLTPAGERLLESMRRDSKISSGTMDGTLCGVALLGVSGMEYDASLAGLDVALKKDLTQMGNLSSSGCSTGCSSGCSSGCGGGCGGCGGD